MSCEAVPRARPDGRLQGAAAITAAVCLLSFSDALAKLAGERFGLAQLVLLRSLAAGALLAAGLRLVAGPGALRLRRAGWVWMRSLCLSGMWLCYYAALPSMSFALAAACYYTSPVWMALATRFGLGAAVGGRGWAAVGLCAAGAVLAVDPAGGRLSPVLLLPLAAGMLYALAGIVTWSRCGEEHPGAMALNLNLCLCATAGLGLLALAALGPGEGFALALWPPLAAADWALAGALGGLLAVIAMAVAFAYRAAPTPLVGVFDTAYLGFAALWGAILFDDPPGGQEALGIALIAAGAILAGLGRGAATG